MYVDLRTSKLCKEVLGSPWQGTGALREVL